MILIRQMRNGQLDYTPGLDMCVQEYIREELDIDEDIIMPYTTDPQVQMGRYQNAAAEVNVDYLKENQIGLSRRDTGGGAIYLDRGNTSFCFLTEYKGNNVDLNFADLYEPVIDVLRDLGVNNVEMSGRNDLTIDGKKVSGAAMSNVNGRIYSGYSLLLEVDAEAMVNALTPNRKKITSKGIDSVRSRVTSIREHLDPEYQSLTNQEFHDLVTCKLLGVELLEDAKEYKLTDEDWKAIDQRMAEKYGNWEWIYGESPRYEYKREERLEGVGTFEVELSINKGRISEIKIFGDFFGSAPIEEVEQALIGVPEEKEAILNVLKEIDLKPYFNAQIDEFLARMIVS